MNEKAKEYFKQSWTNIKLVFQGGLTIIKKGWVIITLSVALAGAAGYIWWLDYKQQKAEEQITQLQDQAVKLEEQSKQLIQLNQENEKVYEQLAKDRAQVEALVTNFNAQLTANAKALTSISKSVNKLEDGEVAPVLKETIRSIQELRLKNEE